MKQTDVQYTMTAKTMAGLENVLAQELIKMNATEVEVLQRAVSFKGDKALMYKANYCCRTALRILKPISFFSINNENELYDKVYNLIWEQYITSEKTIAIDSVVNSSLFSNSLYISQRVKDAIVDRFRAKINRRPSVDIENPDLRINIHINENQCTVSLDSSGISLHKRGYRQSTGLAPINEVLAAGLIALSDWKCDCNFFDPMCGSGTFLIEAAMFAYNIPSGFYRKEFAFMKWKDFDKALLENVVKQASQEQREFNFKIIGSDISSKSYQTARQNIAFAKLNKETELYNISFADFELHYPNGLIIMNPPYGERLKEDNIIALYKSIGDILKKKYAGYEAHIISSDSEALKNIGLRPSKKFIVFNGPLECRFLKFSLYQGSKKTPKMNTEN